MPASPGDASPPDRAERRTYIAQGPAPIPAPMPTNEAATTVPSSGQPGRAQTQPAPVGWDAPTVTGRRTTAPRHPSATDFDARDRRRGTHFHGAQNLVDAGSESPKLRLVPGRVIPGTRYKILRWLGEGGMGVVYEAAHVDIERKSALKILRFDLSRQPRMVQVFRDEARAASRLGSPHIVEIYDFGELPDGRLFFAMELLDGHDLVPTQDEPFTAPGRLIGILRQVCKGLAAAHEAGVVHRDVKPENIIIADTKQRRDVVKIVDFGISSMLAAGDGDTGIAGTPHYMAPEQVLGDPFDGRLDVYALGATAYELLTGQPPFDSESLDDILQAQVSQPPPAPRTVRPDLDLPVGLETVILRCLAKRPEHRYANMAELEAALCEAQIAAGLVTPWDDLPLPELPDPERRARLIAKMPNAPVAPKPRTLLWPVVAGASTMAAAGLAAFLVFGTGPTDEELDIVERLSTEANEAAADQNWVVPTATHPDAATAYDKVLELEAVDGPAERAADDRGKVLRERFAASLVGTADQMWAQGATPLARQFYLYALTFDDQNEHAFARLNMPLLALADFRDRVQNHDFDALDTMVASLAGAEAEQDPEKKKALERDLQLQIDEASPDDSAMIAKVTKGAAIEAEVHNRVTRRGAVAVAPTATARTTDPFAGTPRTVPAPPEPEPEPEPAAAPDGPNAKSRDKVRPRPRPLEQDAGSLLGKAKRDPEKAESLAADGMAALGSGQRQAATALFNQAIAYDRMNAKALMGLSDVYFDTGSNQKAINYAEKAVAAAPGSGAYRIKLGDAYFKVLRYKDAQEQYEKAKSLGASRADERLKKVAAKLGE